MDTSTSSTTPLWRRMISALSIVPRGATPLPPVPIAMATLAIFNCVLHMTILFPFVPQMLRSFGLEEEKIAWYGGFVSSAYFLGAFLGSYVWGLLSDILGRRPVIIICTISSAIAAVFFGLSKNLTWAIASRVATGLGNGVLCTTKAMIGDVTNDSNQPAGMVFYSVGWSGSLLIAPFLGGVLAEPASKYPSLISHLPNSVVKIFREFPFLLPNLTAVFLNIISILVFIAKMPETRKKTSAARTTTAARTAVNDEDANTVSERTALLASSQSHDSLDQVKVTFAGNSAVNTIRTSLSKYCQRSKGVFTIHVVILIISNSIYSYALIGTDEITPLWTALTTSTGGLNFSTNDIGILTGSVAPQGFLFNLYVDPWIVGKFGSKAAFMISSSAVVVTLIVFPYSHILKILGRSNTAILGYLIPIWSFNRIFGGVGFMAISIMTNNCCKKEHLGMVNGVAASASFLSRILAPIVCGAIMSWSCTGNHAFPLNFYLTFYTLAIAVMASCVLNYFLPDSFNYQLTLSEDQQVEESHD